MPRTLYDADENEIEVLTEEEIAELKALADKAKELESSKGELEAKIKEIEQNVNPNWKEARKVIDNLKGALKKQGKDIDDDGNIVEKHEFTPEKIAEIAAKKAQEIIVGQHLKKSLQGYDEEKQKSIRGVFDKLSSGEEVNLDNVDTFFQQAVNTVSPMRPNDPIATAISAGSNRGSAGGSKTNFADTEQGKSLASDLGMSLEEPKK
jgi:hypothetical protein